MPSSFTRFHWRFFERYLASIRSQRDSSGAFPEAVLPPIHTWNGYFMSLSMCVPAPPPHIPKKPRCVHTGCPAWCQELSDIDGTSDDIVCFQGYPCLIGNWYEGMR